MLDADTEHAVRAFPERAAESAKLLLEAGDADGACNRAYYAMYEAARAALLAAGASVAAHPVANSVPAPTHNPRRAPQRSTDQQ